MNDRSRTPAQTIGPFFAIAIPTAPELESAPAHSSDLEIVGVITDGNGDSVGDALVEAWYETPSSAGSSGQFVRSPTDANGRYRVALECPDAHHATTAIDLSIFARGLLRRLVTRLYIPDPSGSIVPDDVLAAIEPQRRTTLYGRWAEGRVTFDIRLQGDGETVFLAV